VHYFKIGAALFCRCQASREGYLIKTSTQTPLCSSCLFVWPDKLRPDGLVWLLCNSTLESVCAVYPFPLYGGTGVNKAEKRSWSFSHVTRRKTTSRPTVRSPLGTAVWVRYVWNVAETKASVYVFTAVKVGVGRSGAGGLQLPPPKQPVLVAFELVYIL